MFVWLFNSKIERDFKVVSSLSVVEVEKFMLAYLCEGEYMYVILVIVVGANCSEMRSLYNQIIAV